MFSASRPQFEETLSEPRIAATSHFSAFANCGCRGEFGMVLGVRLTTLKKEIAASG